MEKARIPEAKIEDLTIEAIIDGTNENDDWQPFRTSLAMSKADAFPAIVRKLEDMMMECAGTLSTQQPSNTTN